MDLTLRYLVEFKCHICIIMPSMNQWPQCLHCVKRPSKSKPAWESDRFIKATQTPSSVFTRQRKFNPLPKTPQQVVHDSLRLSSKKVKWEFLLPRLTISVVLWGSVAAQPLVMWGEKDRGVLVANEALQGPVLMLGMRTEALLQAW